MFRKIIAGCLVAIFIPILMLTLIGFVVKCTIINPEYYKKQFDKKELYQELTANILPNSISNLLSKEQPNFQIEEAIKNNIQVDWVKAQFDVIFSSLGNFFSGKSATLSGEIDLRPLKQALKDVNIPITDLMGDKFKNLPACTQEELKNMDENTDPSQFTCLPPNFDTKNLEQKSSQTIMDIIPDTYDLSNLSKKGTTAISAQIQSILRIFSIILYVGLGLVILIFVSIGLLIWKPWDSVLRWLATTLVIPSGILLIGSIIALVSFNVIIAKMILPGLAQSLVALATVFFEAIFSHAILLCLIYSAIILVLAIILYIVAYCIKKSQK